jgi:hypothetical protein
MKTTLTHTLHDALELRYEDTTLFKYTYNSKLPAFESPRPYFHPIKTLAGNEVTMFRPYDHLWHIGLSMSFAVLSGENFWGGRSYVDGQGYVQLDNNGRTEHVDWQEITCDDTLRCVEHLKWITHANETWLDEEREIVVSDINPDAGYWTLNLTFKLTNVAQKTLEIGSPTTEGRPNAGYGSLFWRGPRSFLHGKILASDGSEGQENMGHTFPWIAITGWHDGNSAQSTLIFIDQPGNPRYPNKWFMRSDPYTCASFAFMFDEIYPLKPDETLQLAYRVVIGNGAWSQAQIEQYVTTH